MIGYKTGKFPNGSIIVSDVIHANEDSLSTKEGERVHIDVMMRDSLKYNDFGGWRFETFDKKHREPFAHNRCANRMFKLSQENK